MAQYIWNNGKPSLVVILEIWLTRGMVTVDIETGSKGN